MRDVAVEPLLCVVRAACEGGPRTPSAASERLQRSCETLLRARRDPRLTGSFYTPGWLARQVADTVVTGVLRGRQEGEAKALSLKILDPAAGSGVFALAGVEAIARAAGEERPGALQVAARDCVFGMEINELAAEAARLVVWLGASRPGLPAAIPGGHMQVADALSPPFPVGEYDAVMGNPPWGVLLDPRRAQAVADLAPEALLGHRDSFLLFLWLAAQAARDDGAVGMLLPDALLWQVRYEGMRRHLLERFRPLRVMLLGDRVFRGATSPACALCLLGRPIAPAHYLTDDLRRAPRRMLEGAASRPGQVTASRAPLAAPHHSFLAPPDWLSELFARLRAALPTLGELAGIQFHDVGINYPRAEIGRAVLYTGEPEDPRDIPVARGRDFGPLTAVGHSAWLRHDWHERSDSVSIRDQVYRTVPKLLFRQTADRPVATLDRKPVWFGRSVIAITARDEQNLLWLVGLFNARSFAALYRAVAPEGGRSFAQVKVGKLKVLPVPTAGRDEVAELAGALLAGPEPERAAALVQQLDAAVYRAYKLTAAEITRVEETVGPCRAAAGSTRRCRPAATWPARRRR